MTVSERATPVLVNSTTSTLTLTIPASSVNGDYLLMLVSSTNTPTLPSGWTQVDLANSNTSADLIAYRVCVGGDAGGTVNVTITSNTGAHGTIIAIAGSIAPPWAQSGASGSYLPGFPVLHQAAGSASASMVTGCGTGMVVYWGWAKVASKTISLSSGTSDATRAADTVCSVVVGHESFTNGTGVNQTFTLSSSTGAFFITCIPFIENPRTGDRPDPATLPVSATNGAPQLGGTGKVIKGHGTAVLDTTGAP